MNNSKHEHSIDEIIMADAQHIGYGGQRETLEDRCTAEKVRSAGGLDLFIGFVADGIGGASAGEAAGQLTIDTVMSYIENSSGTDVNTLLLNSLQAAHTAVRQAARSNVNLRSMGTTATLAAINNGKLYLAHIGDSRAYLVRDGKLTLLTLDHTWGNEKISQGLLTPEQAAAHPRKDDLARYIGQPSAQRIEVDVGLRLDGQTDARDSHLEPVGLVLEAGDVVLLCTDGLIKERPSGRGRGHFVEPDEIVEVIQRNEPQDAANTLLSLALGRQVDDNVSTVIMEVPGKKKWIPWRTLIITILSAVVVGLIVLGMIWLFNDNGPKPPTTAPVAQVSHAVTVEPDLANGYVKVIENLNQINYQVGNQSPSKATSGDQIPAGEDVRLWTISGNAKLGLSDGSVFILDQHTTIWLSSITSDTNPDVKTRVTIERGNVLVLRGPVRMETMSGEFRTWSDGAVMGVRYQPAEGIFRVECFGLTGSCDVQGESGFYELNSGQSMGFEGSSSGNSEPADYESWAGLGGPDMPQASPTPTMTLTMTPSPTPTVAPTLSAVPSKPAKEQVPPKEKPEKPDDPQTPP